MPRYFFHIYDERGVIQDEEGMELADDLAAKREAEISVHEMYAQDLRANTEFRVQYIEVVDSEGKVLAKRSLPRGH